MMRSTPDRLPRRRCSSFFGRLAGERGLALAEVIIATVIFIIVSTALVGMLVSSTSITRVAKERTLAEQGVANQIETIRSTQYDLVGTQNGNPSGLIPVSQPFKGVNGQALGIAATMTTQITFQDSNVPGTYVSGADFKKVVVTITRNFDSKVLAQATTYLAPTVRPAQNTGTISAKVIDFGNNAAMPGVAVSLSNGPSANRTDTTDGAGNVTFAGLLPNPTSGGQQYYDLAATLPPGYVALADLTQTHVQLSPTQAISSILNIYQPGTLNVSLFNTDGSAYTGAASVTVSSSRGSRVVSYPGSPLAITSLLLASGELLIPGLNYTIDISQAGKVISPSSQTVFMASGPNPSASVSAVVSVLPSKLVFTSAPVSGPASATANLGPITVQQQTAAGVPVIAGPGGRVVSLTSSSGTGVFSTTSGGAPVSSVTIPNGASSVTFFYGDTKAGTPTITGQNAGIATNATQQETITAGAATSLVFTSSPLAAPSSAATNLGPITVQRQDVFGNPTTTGGALVVTLSSNTTGTARFSLASGGASITTVTIAAGASSVNFFYGDTKAGTPTITGQNAGIATNATQQETITASKLVFTSTAVSGSASATANLGAITVQRQDSLGTAVTVGGPLVVSLSSNSAGTAVFSLTSGGATVTSVTIPSGSSSATFYYGDTKAASPTITGQNAAVPTNATQVETITPAAVSKLVFTSAPISGARTAGPTASLGPITVQRQDTFGNPVTTGGAIVVTLSSNTTGVAKFALTSGGASVTTVTIAAGASSVNFFYGDTKAGNPRTITGSSGALVNATQNEIIT